MTLSRPITQDYYSETEAAQALGITVGRLHQLLDRYVFNVGTRRPPNIEFTSSDLLLLSYWSRESNASPESHDNVISIDDYK